MSLFYLHIWLVSFYFVWFYDGITVNLNQCKMRFHPGQSKVSRRLRSWEFWSAVSLALNWKIIDTNQLENVTGKVRMIFFSECFVQCRTRLLRSWQLMMTSKVCRGSNARLFMIQNENLLLFIMNGVLVLIILCPLTCVNMSSYGWKRRKIVV